MFEKFESWLKQFTFFRQFLFVTKKYSFFGLDGASVYFVGRFFATSIINGDLNNRAASIAFSFFLAIFPGIIFLFTLIPIIPIEDFQETLLMNIEQVLPIGVKNIAMDTITDLIETPRGGLLSLNFILTLYFATNGIYSLMDQFNNTYLFNERRNFIKQRLIAFALVLISTLLLIIAIFLISFSGTFVNYLVDIGLLAKGLSVWIVTIGKYSIAFLLFYFVIAFLYYFGPAKRKRWKFFSAGSSVATVFLILTTLAFGFYVKNLNQYNKIYGSIGTIMIVMLWFQLNAIIMLIGFELNAAISKAKEEGRPTSSIAH